MSRYAVCQMGEERSLVVAYGETFEEAIRKAEECGIRTGKRYIVIPEEELAEKMNRMQKEGPIL
ncbi:hypothetical protein J2S09_005152 [Bacillus fengqiuensis]|nr:hypothetical protein [Bacillus fengqiuensis]